MITSAENAPWPLDVEVTDLSSAGLPSPSKVRMKVFTLDDALIDRRLGALSATDGKNVRDALSLLFV